MIFVVYELAEGCLKCLREHTILKHFQSKRQDKTQNLITETAEAINARSSKLVPCLSFMCPLVNSAFREERQ